MLTQPCLPTPASIAASDEATPQPRRFLTAEWRYLAMLNFAVDPAVVEPYLSSGLELDFFQGRTFVSMVGFRFLNTRVLGLALPWHRCFDEVNLRFYVKRGVGSEMRRGVMFIRELAPRRLVAWVARRFFNENYQTVPMCSTVILPERNAPGRVAYAWDFGGRRHALELTIAGQPGPPPPDSEAEFITEHYWGYSRQRDGGTMEYGVEHAPWRIWPAQSCAFDCAVAALYGAHFAPFLCEAPSSAFVADGSAVLVRRGVRIA